MPARCVACVCGVPGHLAPVHRCARSACCFVCAVSLATWLLFTGVPAGCVALGVRCPGPLGSCSPMCALGVLCCVCGVLGHLAPVHRCARSACCVVCAVSWATWLLFTGVPAVCAMWRVRCPGPLAPGHRCARSVCCFACAVSWATWLLFTCVPARCVACVCGVLGHLAPVHRCARSACCFVCVVSLATWLLFTGVPARCVALRVRCHGPLGSCSPVCPLGVLPMCAVSWASWLLFTGVSAQGVVLLVRCPGPLGSCLPVCPLGVLFFLRGVLGHSAPVHRCARSVRCLCVRCPGPLGPPAPVRPRGALFSSRGVLGHLAPVHRCARSVCCVACAVSWATWLLFTGVPARCVVLRVRCPGPLGSCSPVRSPGVLCGVLGHLAPGHRCARSVCCAVGCVCGASLRRAHSSIRTVAIRSRQGLGTLRARTRPSGRRLFCSRQGLGILRAHTRPSGRRLFRSRQGLGSLPGAHTSVRTAAGVAWHLSSCRGSLRVVRALRVCGTRRPSLLGTCLCALVLAGGVPLWRASWPRVVRRASSGPVALGALVGFPYAVVPFPTAGACAPGFTGWLRGARGGRPRTGLIVPSAGPR